MNGNVRTASLFLAFFLLLFPALQVFLCGFFKKRAGGSAEAAAMRHVCLRQALLDLCLSGGVLLILFLMGRMHGLLWGLLAVLLFVQLGGIMRTLKQCRTERENMAHQLLALVLTILHIILIFWAAGFLF